MNFNLIWQPFVNIQLKIDGAETFILGKAIPVIENGALIEKQNNVFTETLNNKQSANLPKYLQ